MPDVHLVQYGIAPRETSVSIDWLLNANGTLDETMALASAVIVALGTDRRAMPSDILPDPDDDDRRGWWGDTEAQSIWDAWPIGSRLWLLRRAKITGAGAREGSTIARVEAYIYEALQPFITRGVASRIVASARINGIGRIDATVTIYRGPEEAVDLRFESLWEDF